MKKTHELAFSAYSRANGVQFLAFFGVFWLAGSVLLPLQSPPPFAFAFDLTALGCGAVLAILIFRRAQATKRATRAQALSPLNASLQASRSRGFRWINAGQYLALGVAAVLLLRVHRSDLLIPVGIGIVGVHFLPLAGLYRYPFHLVTGALLVVWAMVYPHWSPLGGWNPFGLSITGLILLGSAGWSSYTAARLAAAANKIQ